MAKTYKKINYDEIVKEKCEVQPYMKTLSYDDALMKFRLRADMVDTVKCHWKSEPKYEDELWSCWHCPATDRSSHIRCCREYADLREDLDLSKDDQLATFFRRVIERRRQVQEIKDAL